jgi:hypothetical protein
MLARALRPAARASLSRQTPRGSASGPAGVARIDHRVCHQVFVLKQENHGRSEPRGQIDPDRILGRPFEGLG